MIDATIDDNNCVSKNIHKVNYVAACNRIRFLNKCIFCKKLVNKIMFVKEKINIWCKRYLSTQPLFGNSDNEIILPRTGISLSNIYSRSDVSATYEHDEMTSTIGVSHQLEQDTEDSLMQLVYNYPEKSIWFLSYILNAGIVSFLCLGTFTIAFTLYFWNSNYQKSPFLTLWLLVHGLLQLIQAFYRCCYKIMLKSVDVRVSNVRILHILQTVKKLTTSKIWRIGKIFSFIYYLWFITGFYWILSFRPVIDSHDGMEDFENQVTNAHLINHSYILNRHSYLLLGNYSISSLKNFAEVDFFSILWSFYLLIMLLCTFRIVVMLFFFYFVFPAATSNEYFDNRSRAFTLNKLEVLPVKTYLEWRDIVEREFPDNIHNMQDSCIICLSDFSSSDMMRRLPCNHLFHEDCIDIWLLRNAICPLCQAVLE